MLLFNNTFFLTLNSICSCIDVHYNAQYLCIFFSFIKDLWVLWSLFGLDTVCSKSCNVVIRAWTNIYIYIYIYIYIKRFLSNLILYISNRQLYLNSVDDHSLWLTIFKINFGSIFKSFYNWQFGRSCYKGLT